MLYQSDRGWLGDAVVEKMLAPLTEAGRERVRNVYHDVIRFLQERKDWKGLGHADVVTLTFNSTQLNLTDRGVLYWILKKSGDFTVHMEVTPQVDGFGSPTCKIDLVLMW